MLENRDCRFVLLLDMNCNFYDPSHPYSKLLIDMMERFSLKSAFDLIPSFDPKQSYTRCDVKTNSYTLIDGILVSESLMDRICNVRISHCGENVSDHSPVELDIHLSLSEVPIKKIKLHSCILWSKLNQEAIELYQQKMDEKLNEIHFSFPSLLHGDKCCSNTNHFKAIETYHRSIVNAIWYAESFLPKTERRVYNSIRNSVLPSAHLSV